MSILFSSHTQFGFGVSYIYDAKALSVIFGPLSIALFLGPGGIGA